MQTQSSHDSVRNMVWKLVFVIVSFTYAAFKLLLLLMVISNLAPTRQIVTEKITIPEKTAIPERKFDRDEKLQAESDALLPLFDNMPSVPVYVNDDPILKSGTNTEKGVAYTNCDDHQYPSIFFKKNFYQKTNRKQLINILKHELTHAWLCRQRLMFGHDARFRQKFSQVGGFGN